MTDPIAPDPLSHHPQLAETPEADPLPPPTFETPFEHIALAFSGGGFRAASFSLGVLSYFDSLSFTDHTAENAPATLLQKIRFVSSASGGTITNACFALAVAQGHSFKTFYTHLYSRLEGDQLMRTALQKLNSSRAWQHRPYKSRNLINAFALAYDDLLFDHKTLGHLLQRMDAQPDPYPMNVPLEEVCFNTTEFFRGLPFRQDIRLLPDDKTDKFLYGNYYLHLIDPTVNAKIKISDTLAASSCFPIGFEPLRFPEDFAHVDLPPETLHEALLANKSMLTKEECDFVAQHNIGFMDGGITDNQGLESMIIANNRRIKGQIGFAPFDLLLVNDVGSQYMQPYLVPKVNKESLLGRLSYNNLQWIFAIAVLVGIGLGIAGYTTDRPIGKTFTGLSGLLLGLLILTFVLGRYLPGKLIRESTSNFKPGVVRLLLGFFRHTNLSIVQQLLSARISSAITLTNDVFLKRIRSLIYNSFYANPLYDLRRKGNHIYDLSFTNDLNRKAHPPSPNIVPTKEIQIVAQASYEMPTTLWFDTHDETSLPCIVACGQFSTCYNLLDYTQRLIADTDLMKRLHPGYRSRVIAIHARLLDDWNEFCKNPFWLFNRSVVNKSLTIDGEKIKIRATT